MSKTNSTSARSAVPYGTLDLLILKSLEVMGPLNGYALARRIEQTSNHHLSLNQGSIYPALIRLQQRGWIDSQSATSETNRKVKLYSLTTLGAKQLAVEIDSWERTVGIVSRFLEAKP